MKNINKSFYIIIFLIAFILLGIYLYLNQTDSGENINVSQNNAEIEKNISQKEDFEESQPKEIRIVAEEILYPDEYDFGDSMSKITLAVGKPVKFDAWPLIHAKQGDLIEIEIDQYHYVNKVLMTKIEEYKSENVMVFYFETENSELDSRIYWDITFDYNEKIIEGIININNSVDSKSIVLNKNLALYYFDHQWQKEFYKRGYKID